MKLKLFLAFFVAMGMCLTVSIAGAVTVNLDTTAQFDDTSGTGVDLFPGTAGEGWASAWSVNTSGATVYKTIKEPTDGDYAPFDADNDNYLYVRTTPSSAVGKGAIFRDYAGGLFNSSQDYSISFSFRAEDLSTFGTSGSGFYFYGDPNETYGTSTASTFQLRAVGQSSTDATRNFQWFCYDGDNAGGNLDSYWSGVYLVEGHIYDFDITMHPSDKSWDFSVTDQNFDVNAVPATAIENPVATATITGLGWRGSDHGTNLHFATRSEQVGERLSYSVDDIHVTQSYSYEPISEVVANFDGGNSTTVVDGFTGMAGDGWAGEWKVNTYASTSPETIVSTTSVITSGDSGYQELGAGDGNYLKVEVNNPSADSRIAVSRSYRGQPSVDFTQEHEIQFTIRIDEVDIGGEWTYMDASYDRYWVSGSSEDKSASSSDDTFFVMATGDPGSWGDQVVEKWAFSNGDKAGGITDMIGSGIELVSGGVYDFTITMNTDDQTYDVILTDGTSTFEISGLGWRTDADVVGGFLNFGAQADSWIDTRSMSIDNIMISQEDWIKGDANKDGFVDGSDAALLANNWQATGATWAMGDFTGDGVVDGSDAALLANNWQTGTPPTSAVPEPSTLVGLLVLLLAGVGLVRRR